DGRDAADGARRGRAVGRRRPAGPAAGPHPGAPARGGRAWLPLDAGARPRPDDAAGGPRPDRPGGAAPAPPRGGEPVDVPGAARLARRPGRPVRGRGAADPSVTAPASAGTDVTYGTLGVRWHCAARGEPPPSWPRRGLLRGRDLAAVDRGAPADREPHTEGHP